MPEISIKKFSCIREANICLTKVNIIIGPQGSGKNVTTKLLYFFVDIINDSMRHAEDGLSFSDYKKVLQKKFSVWFPPLAWGDERFHLNYNDARYSVRIMRRVSAGKPASDVSIKFSEDFEKAYEYALERFSDFKRSTFNDFDDVGAKFSSSRIDDEYSAKARIREFYRKSLGASIVDDQTFIPAGRAFFTSIGRLVAGIEHAGSLDPATLRFAKIFAGWRDRLEIFHPHFSELEAYHSKRKQVMSDLFDGAVQSKRDLEYIEMKDGRKVPFSSLSSGQQELLPIWFFLDNIMLLEALQTRRSKKEFLESHRELVFIEEPEAHLFPMAQSKLLDNLLDIVVGGVYYRYLIITTHSPYIMSKLNVLLKAGHIARRRKKNKELNEIVPRSTWLQLADASALSIDDGVVKSIMDIDTELIDAAFLDSISDVIADQFDQLLDLEGTL